MDAAYLPWKLTTAAEKPALQPNSWKAKLRRLNHAANGEATLFAHVETVAESTGKHSRSIHESVATETL